MKSYDIPETDDLTPEQATQALNAFSAAARGDKEHPYFTRGHPQHEEFVTFVNRLGEIKHSGEAEAARLAQDAAINACVAEDEVDLYAEPEAQIKALEAIPGFMNGELRQNDRPRHDRILAVRSALYARRENEVQTTEENSDV